MTRAERRPSSLRDKGLKNAVVQRSHHAIPCLEAVLCKRARAGARSCAVWELFSGRRSSVATAQAFRLLVTAVRLGLSPTPRGGASRRSVLHWDRPSGRTNQPSSSGCGTDPASGDLVAEACARTTDTAVGTHPCIQVGFSRVCDGPRGASSQSQSLWAARALSIHDKPLAPHRDPDRKGEPWHRWNGARFIQRPQPLVPPPGAGALDRPTLVGPRRSPSQIHLLSPYNDASPSLCKCPHPGNSRPCCSGVSDGGVPRASVVLVYASGSPRHDPWARSRHLSWRGWHSCRVGPPHNGATSRQGPGVSYLQRESRVAESLNLEPRRWNI